jgi:hypothetical protein
VCQHEVAELRRLRTLLTSTAAVADPDWTGFWPGVVRGIQDRRTTPVHVTSRRWRPQWALGGALAVALLVVSLGVWEFGPQSEPGVLVRSASTGDPRATVMVYGPPERDVAVVWVLGLGDSN